MKKILLLMMGLFIFSLGLFAEIPHSYVTENPDKEVTQTETLKKYKEKGELNLSITKIKSKEVEGLHNPEQKKIYFSLDNIEYEIQPGDKIYLSEELQEVPSISITNGRKKINGMLNQKVLKENTFEYTINKGKNITEIEMNYLEIPREIYIGILNNQYNIKNILKFNNNMFNLKALQHDVYDRWNEVEITDEYNSTWVNSNIKDFYPNDKMTTGMKFIKGSENKFAAPGILDSFQSDDYEVTTKFTINGIDGKYRNNNGTTGILNQQMKLSEDLIIEVDQDPFSANYLFRLAFRLIKYPKEDFSITFHIEGRHEKESEGGKLVSYSKTDKINFIYKPSKLEGTSNLTLDTTYKPEYIPFTSCTIDNKQSIGLENTVTGVTLSQASGNGLITLEHNDILEVNGKQYTIGFDGNLPERHDTLGKIDYSLKTVNGKLQLKVDKYGLGIDQPQPLNLKVIRANTEVMTHTMNIKVPKLEKVVGESDLGIGNDYNQSQYIFFSSCTLENPKDISLSSSTPGVQVVQYSGKGIVKFESGDILDVNGIKYIVNSSGGINERNLNLSGINIYYKAQNGNFQIRIDDYQIEQDSPQVLSMKLTRSGIEIMDHKIFIHVPKITINNSKMNVKIRDEYKGQFFNIFDMFNSGSGIEFMSGDSTISVITPAQVKMPGLFFVNNNLISHLGHYIRAVDLNLGKVRLRTKESEHFILSLTNYEKKISKPFSIKIESQELTSPKTRMKTRSDNSHGTPPWSGDGGTQPWNKRVEIQEIVFYYVPSKVVGQSTLEVKEYYPSPEYIKFNSCTTPAPAPIELENSLRDVKVIQNSGNGLVNLESGDVLELNGKQYTITAGGTLQEQSDTLGNINFKFKVENGKIRLALTSWGVLEPDRLLTINASREGHPIMEHKMTIKAPRRVEGTSTLKFTEKYPIRDIVRFQGISLTAPNIGGIEPPIPAGVSYRSNDGYGIPFMKEGDILEVQCETMRATQKYIIDSKNSLKHQTIDLPGTVLSLLVEDGKLRLGLNNWLVNKNTVLNFRVIRGVNEISNTSITLEVPKAPFDILKNGILDFGKLIQGSKNKKAETSILLEMHQDISNVKFSLSTTTPELVNSSGATLQARNLQAGVQKQGNKRHLVRIIGRLDVPEKQELGVYRGSVLLNVTIK